MLLNNFVDYEEDFTVSEDTNTGNQWTEQLIDLLCSLHIPVLHDYNSFGKVQKESVCIYFQKIVYEVGVT